MIQVKTSELTCAALDWAVAKAIGRTAWQNTSGSIGSSVNGGGIFNPWLPSTSWAQGGYLIDQYCPSLTPVMGGTWEAELGYPSGGDDYCTISCRGNTALESFCRVLVLLKLGDSVEIPDELMEVSQ